MHFNDLITGFPGLTTTGITQGAIYALVALGYTLVYGVLRLINFAHSEVFMIGTFASLIIWDVFGFNNDSTRPGVVMALVMIAVGCIFAALASGATGMLVEVIAYRPLRRRNAPPLAFLISAIGASYVIAELMGAITLRRPFGVPAFLPTEPLFHIGSWKVTPLQLLTVATALAMMFGLERFVAK